MSANFKAFKAIITNPIKYQLFLFNKLPMAFLAGLKLLTLQEDTAMVSVRFKWLNQNPFRSMYFAVMAMAAELSTGILAVAQTYKSNPSVSMLVVKCEGEFYKNLSLSMGIEMRYYTPYKAYNYSPVTGQFMPQDTVTLKNLPDISAFFHFRIKSFTSYVRAENLNTINFANGFGFTNNNFAAPHYPTPGFIFRLGIQWGFVN